MHTFYDRTRGLSYGSGEVYMHLPKCA